MDSKADELPLSDKVWTWFEANKKQALIGLGIVVLAGAIAGFVAWRRSETESASGEALSNAVADQVAAGPGGSAGAAGQYLKVADEYPKTTAGARAVLLAAGSLFQQGQYDQAKAQFEKFAREYPENPLMGEALLGIAACLEAQGKTTEAASAYKSLVERHPTDNVAPQAHFALGRIYESQGKPDLARIEYESVIRIEQPYGGNSLANEAGLRLEEFKWKYPNLMPPPPTPSSPNAPLMLGTNPPQVRIPSTNAPRLKLPSTNPPQLKLLTTNPPQLEVQPSTNK